jgi:hypothetical protein
MDTRAAAAGRDSCYELRFAGLFNAARGYAFPCDAQGQVDVSLLSERARANYRRACANVGRDFFWPVPRMLRAPDADLPRLP